MLNLYLSTEDKGVFFFVAFLLLTILTSNVGLMYSMLFVGNWLPAKEEPVGETMDETINECWNNLRKRYAVLLGEKEGDELSIYLLKNME
ncbi:hypothetical protein SAMN03159341_107213 [Paenibacillus sp. 1_12]|uniref:hypothetical protein n=1 Tax=Paenibacillus sp. 1_12 TaxID=1566278 RepID=UPI0008E4C0E2|nr:hypothetical protein [Paenibacillus sp. 1_12]SFL57821.1 hypothetical protein SAMN03159341_107213 [Paenibacillus sp. 1_12]